LARVYVRHSQGKQFSAPHTSIEVYDRDLVQRVIYELIEDYVDLVFRADLNFFFLNFGWADDAGDVARQNFAFYSPLKCPVQHTMSMPDRARR
jgi:hypothetical protein